MGMDGKGAREIYREIILENIEYEYLVQDSHIDRDQLDEIAELIVDTVCSARNEITDRNIKAFSHVAKKYHVDFALKKDTTAEQPRYLVFFKSRDADAITAAFQEFASRKMGREEKPSIRERLAQKAEHRTIDREKVKVKDRSVQR